VLERALPLLARRIRMRLMPPCAEAAAKGIKPGQMFQPIRVAVRAQGRAAAVCSEVQGDLLKRIDQAIQRLRS
jgi:hypothetical protein